MAEAHEEHVALHRDVEFEDVMVDPHTMCGIARVRMPGPVPVPPDWLRADELVEILEGFKVVAVGRITAAPES